MSDEIRVNRPMQTQSQTQGGTRGDMQAQSGMPPSDQKPSRLPWVILGIVVLAIIILGVLFRDKLSGKGTNEAAAPSSASSSAPSGYQAVFLTNGQVYFGKLSDPDGDYATLADIFYLQVVQPPLQGNQQAGQTSPQAQAQPQISLVKLGNELHGPVDLMHISRSQILFYEDLKSDGQVVKAIQAYKANPSGAAPAPVPGK